MALSFPSLARWSNCWNMLVSFSCAVNIPFMLSISQPRSGAYTFLSWVMEPQPNHAWHFFASCLPATTASSFHTSCSSSNSFNSSVTLVIAEYITVQDHRNTFVPKKGCKMQSCKSFQTLGWLHTRDIVEPSCSAHCYCISTFFRCVFSTI